jgi:hypothetical protein
MAAAAAAWGAAPGDVVLNGISTARQGHQLSADHPAAVPRSVKRPRSRTPVR